MIAMLEVTSLFYHVGRFYHLVGLIHICTMLETLSLFYMLEYLIPIFKML